MVTFCVVLKLYINIHYSLFSNSLIPTIAKAFETMRSTYLVIKYKTIGTEIRSSEKLELGDNYLE